MFEYSLDNKRYHTLNYYYKNKYGTKVIKVPVDLHTSCPNKITGGCLFCSEDFACPKTNLSIKEQLLKNKIVMDQKWPNSKYIIYFQNNTNTYGDFKKLSKKIDEALTIPDVIGISIATRPDTISDLWIDYFSRLNLLTDLTIELGLESSNLETLKLINRGHDVDCFINMVNTLHKHNIKVVSHIINGLPNDTFEDMINTAILLDKIKIDGVKIHMLYINKNTKLLKYYEENRFHILSEEEYIKITVEQLRRLDPKIVIHRITGDPLKEELVEPKWILKKCNIINDIDKYMAKNNYYQGDYKQSL